MDKNPSKSECQVALRVMKLIGFPSTRPSASKGAAIFALACLAMGSAVAADADPVDSLLYSGLSWRNVGPFRGGRVSAVSGAIGQPGTFYMGLPMGGVWKTTSAGVTWYPVFDDIKTASCVGSVEVAPSDPNVVYVGMGDLIAGGGISEGDGLYKSVDAGKTWQHLGLEETKQIPSILVDPHDPNVVLVAAQGNIREKSENRGLYRSTDGGTTWSKTLFVDDQTGIQKIAWAYDKPSVMLATTVRHYNAPSTGGRGGGFGGRGSAGGTKLFKSTDEGVTWTELTGGGLPELSGRTSVAIAMNTDAMRMFIVGNFGLYRSDDGGATWRQMDVKDRRVANGQGGYNCGVYVNTKNPDIVYVINTCSYWSRDGGETFTGFKGAPGGDDPQQLWLDPTNGDRLFFGTDQGATVSLDGGKNWSPWYNQPTAQTYHISTDNQYPYWIYATQQDSGCVTTSSRGNLGAITPLDWAPHPGYEFGSIVADPLNPKISYAGGAGGGIVKATNPSGQWVTVSPNIDPTERLRRVGNQPLGFCPTNPKELLAGYQYLMATTDGGQHWKKLSPDLGYPKGVAPPKPGQITSQTVPDEALMEALTGDDEEQEMQLQNAAAPGGAIESFSCSTVNPGVIWVGTNNGLVKLTKDHGKTWDDATIPNLPNPTRADVSSIDASHQDAGTAYVAIDCHTSGDLSPHFYRTHDFGKTWTEIVKGLPTDLPSGSFARVLRCDTQRAGLLFAGTESFVYVSFNDGDDWQSLSLNLPNTSYRDMAIHENDLVVGTYGRGFWILDDISCLRQLSQKVDTSSVVLFQPGEAVRVRRNVNGDTPFPPEIPHAKNAPVGALIAYYLAFEPKGKVEVTISDASGRVVRHMSSDPIPKLDEPPAPVPDFWLEVPEPLPSKKGMFRFNWNLRYDSPDAFSHSYGINANPGETPRSPEGPLVLPGKYKVTLTVDGTTRSQDVVVKNDPRSPATIADLRAQFELQMKLYSSAQEAYRLYQAAQKLQASVADIVATRTEDDVKTAGKALDTRMLAIIGTTGGRRFGGGGQSQAPTIAGVDSALLRQLENLDSGDMAPNEPQKKSCESTLADYKNAGNSWNEVVNKDLAEFNAILAKHNIKQIAFVLDDGVKD